MLCAPSQTVAFLSCIFRLVTALRLEMASKKSKQFWSRQLFINMCGTQVRTCSELIRVYANDFRRQIHVNELNEVKL